MTKTCATQRMVCMQSLAHQRLQINKKIKKGNTLKSFCPKTKRPMVLLCISFSLPHTHTLVEWKLWQQRDSCCESMSEFAKEVEVITVQWEFSSTHFSASLTVNTRAQGSTRTTGLQLTWAWESKEWAQSTNVQWKYMYDEMRGRV